MKSIIDNYSLFFKFIDQYLPCGFKDIDSKNPLIRKLEELTEANNQFFSVLDLLQMKFVYTSRRSKEVLGVESTDFNFSVFNKSMYQEDLMWFNIMQGKLFNLGHQIFMDKSGTALVSTNFKFINSRDEVINTLYQSYLFFTEVSYQTVFVLQIMTDISWFKKATPGYHFYQGNDPYYFRYPDEQLLLKGNVFSDFNSTCAETVSGFPSPHLPAIQLEI